MFCCSNCFRDPEIKAILDTNKSEIGNCDFCKSRGVYVHNLDTSTNIAELLDGVLDVYTDDSNFLNSIPKDQKSFLKNALHDDWSIFNLEPDDIYHLITRLCHTRYEEQSKLFDSPVAIASRHDNKYLEEHSILKNHSWPVFVDDIKRKNRFHTNHINKDKLIAFLRCSAKTLNKGEKFYRARVCQNQVGYKCEEMGAPPNDKARAGRVNPDGISVLYLSNNELTTLYEVRAGMYDYVTIGTFELQEDINIIDLTNLDCISPFLIGRVLDLTQYAINIQHLKMIAKEIAKPLRNECALDYLPTQYISDFIHSQGFNGIKYKSTLYEEGYNLAIFDTELFKCIETKVCDIESIKYQYKKI